MKLLKDNETFGFDFTIAQNSKIKVIAKIGTDNSNDSIKYTPTVGQNPPHIIVPKNIIKHKIDHLNGILFYDHINFKYLY